MKKIELIRLLAECLVESHLDEINNNHHGDPLEDCSYCKAINKANKMIAEQNHIVDEDEAKASIWFSQHSGEEMAMSLLRFINNMAVDDDAFVKGLVNSHRTLQQSIMRVFIKFVKEIAAKKDGFYDLRNEASVNLAKEIMKLNTGLPFI